MDDTGGDDEAVIQHQMMALDRLAIIPCQGLNFSVHSNHH